VFRRLTPDVRRYLIVYELDSAGVMVGGPYLVRLNAPTDWSRRMMPRLGNFVRGGGRVEAQAGTGWGGFVAAVCLSEVPDDSWRDPDPGAGDARERCLVRRGAARRGSGRGGRLRRAITRAGRIVLVGMGGDEITLPLAHLQTHELELTGTFRYANTWPDAIALAASGRVNLDALVTGHYGLVDAEQALTATTRDPSSIKVIVQPQQ
jgi:hypothetical protein